MAVLPEAAAEQRVGRLVRDDPRHRELEREPRRPDDRDRDEHEEDALRRGDRREARKAVAGERERGGGLSDGLASLLGHVFSSTRFL